MAYAAKNAAALCLAFLTFAAHPAAAEERRSNYSSNTIAQYGFRETGETRLCLKYTKLDALIQIDVSEFLFASEDKHFLNITQSDCPFTPGQESSAKFMLKTGLICKNTTMYVNGNLCTLSYFRILERTKSQGVF